MKDKSKNEIDEYQEWVEHQYNSGYWAGRFKRLGFPPKRGKWMWLWSFIDLFTIIPMNILFLIAYFLNGEIVTLVMTIALIPMSFLSIFRTRRFKPVDQQPDQAELDERRHKEKEIEKRRKANRRKDYH